MTIAAQPDYGARLWVQIQGIPCLFSDGALPVGPTGATWSAAPTLADDGSVVPAAVVAVLPVLDTRSGLVDSGSEITRSTGDVTPSSMKFTFREDGSDSLLTLFARHRTTGLQVNLADDVPYGDNGSPGYQTLTVDSTSGWTVGDLLYFGRETLIVDSIAAGPPRLLCSRNHYALEGSQGRFMLDVERPSSPRIVSNFPRVWVGRYIRLWSAPVAADGTAYDADWFGSNAREVWRGVINADPRPGQDWTSWELQADSIESILRTEIGLESRKGSLLRVPGNLEQNVAGAVEPPAGAPAPQAAYWMDSTTSKLDVTVTKWTDHAAYLAGTAPLDVWDYTGASAIVVGSATPTVWTRALMVAAFEQTLALELRTTTGLQSFSAKQSNGTGRWWFAAFDVSAYYIVTLNLDADDSIGRLLGWSGIVSVPSTGSPTWAPIGSEVAVFVSRQAKRVPFFYEQTISSAASAPAAGYAIIGDDKAVEVVRYTSITSLADDLAGLYVLDGCERGRFGTAAQDHVSSGAETDPVPVQFGIGWDDGTPFPEIILALATSTGAAVNGAYDTLTDGVGARLSLAHFDTPSFTRLGERLAAWESRRPMLLVKGTKLSELVGAWLQPVGRFVTAKTLTDGTYRISLGDALPAIESAADTAITTREIQLEPAPKYGSAGRIINQVRAFYHWNPAKSEPTDTAYVDVIDDDSVAEYGVRNKIEWKMPGWTTDSATALAVVFDMASDVFRRFGRPFDIISFDTDRSALALSPGDTITLTIPGFPSTRGTRGETTSAVVLQVEKRHAGEEIGGSLRVAIETPERFGRYVPCARVTAWDGTTGVTLSTSEFAATGDTDYTHFRMGDVVWVYEDEADVTTRVARTIATVSTSAVTFTAALPGGFTAGADTLVTFADYGSAVARQCRFAYVTGNDGLYTSGTPTEGFKYA